MPVASPCIRLCVLDPETGLCEGCGRTLAEIAAWGTLPDAERAAILAALPERLRPAAAAPPGSAPARLPPRP